MKLDQLRKIIREEVKAAVKEEVQDMLIEAVKVASTPQTNLKEVEAPKNSNLKWSTPATGNKSLDEMLTSTRQSMTSEDFKSVGSFDSSKIAKPNFASSMATQMQRQGGDAGISFAEIPGFDPAKAKAVLDASLQKDKFKKGLS